MALSRPVDYTLAARIFTRGSPPTLALLKAVWPAAVGPELARRTEVLALEGNALRVRIPDARWRKVLHRMQPQILAHLRRVAGDLVPRRLGFNEGGLEGWDGPAEVLAEAQGGARTPTSPAELPDGLAAAAGCIDDPEIRALFERSAARYLAAFRR